MLLFDFHWPMEPCHPGARFKQAFEAMSSRRSVQTGIYNSLQLRFVSHIQC